MKGSGLVLGQVSTGSEACSRRESILERPGSDRGGGGFKASPEGLEVNIKVGPFVKPQERKGKRTMLREERINPSLNTNRADKEQITRIRTFGGNGFNTRVGQCVCGLNPSSVALI